MTAQKLKSLSVSHHSKKYFFGNIRKNFFRKIIAEQRRDTELLQHFKSVGICVYGLIVRYKLLMTKLQKLYPLYSMPLSAAPISELNFQTNVGPMNVE